MSNTATRFAALASGVLLACAGAPTTTRGPDGAAAPPVSTPRPAAGEERAALDLDRDGTPDRWHVTIAADAGARRLVRTEHDLDGDGRVDRWDEHGPDGVVVRTVLDLDLDGRADTVLRYEGGAVGREVRLPGLVAPEPSAATGASASGAAK